MEKGPQLHCSGDELGQGAAPGTLPWSPLLPVGQGKGGSGEGTRDTMGTSSAVGAAARCGGCARHPCHHPGGSNHGATDRNLLGCPLCPHPYVPFRALTLATRSWKPWAQRLGTSSSTISIFRPVYPVFSNRWILWSALSWGQGRVRGCPQPCSPQWPPQRSPTHNLEGPEGHQAVAAVAVGPRVPAGVVTLLQHELLPGVGLALEAQPPAGPQRQGAALPATPQGCSIFPTPDLRARLHLDGAHLLHLLLGDVGELFCQLTPFALEILQLIDRDLR